MVSRLTPVISEIACCDRRVCLTRWFFGVPAVVAGIVADCQILNMAVTTLAQGLNMLKRGVSLRYMFATDPARNLAVQLAGHGFIDLVTGQ